MIQNKYFKNANGTGRLTVQGNSDGTKAFIYNCTGLADQKWTAELIPGRNGAVQYRKANTNLCLTAQGSSVGTAAMQYTCYGYADQIWAA
ncbi:RICIN domain-containing protein [Kitasatospora sp. NBC_01560]|uniref:RICIN domain-containing protein n=1 Tax=Kitasatospora sp. NBC_01560 TaxID=2975965 RepID=UPI0038641291